MPVPAVVSTRPSAADQSSHHGLELQFGRVVLDRYAHTVSVDGRPVPLTPREFSLLVYLTGHVGRLLTRGQLVHEVWGERYSGGPRTVDIHVSRLRRKLGTDLPLDTVRRLGYRFGGRGLSGQGDRGSPSKV
jgi:DNA-binding response OmpR family regulator